ncbi:MAG TPA: LLM class flavin-dependent oxidoreductase [Acidimicrobiales bacterium]|nr:LLM class flavin-dependent oxidoreductase [Acidimicrobiales bacterium]
MTTVDDARRALGGVGAFLPAPYDVALRAGEQRAAARRLEAAGWRAVWLNEAVGGKDTMVQAAMLLAATETLTVGTGIANIWARPAVTLHGGAAGLADAFPGRFVLGIGVGYAHQAELVGQHFGPPAPTMRAYLEAMATPTRLPAPDAPYARILAANGPRLLELARDRADGALPAMRPPEFTAEVRALLGPEKLLVAMVHLPAGQPDAEVAAGVEAHRAAGADHVLLTPDLGAPYGPAIDQFERLAAALT